MLKTAMFIFGMTFGAAAAHAQLGTGSEQLDQPVRPVEHVDLDRYAGTWYDVGSYPQRFQRGCHCTRARYTKNDDGTIAVVNSCNRDSVGGRYSVARATGVVQPDAVSDGSNSRLKVYFFLPWLRLFGGDYWIVGLDEEYRWAVVSEPSRKYLWILSRTPVLDPVEMERAKSVIVENGLDLSRLQWTVQVGCSYPE
jgi:apolipoprotein D and lipocalin family protein